MSDKKTLVSRRFVVKSAGVVAGVGTIGAGALAYSSQPALAASGSVDTTNVNLEENEESITEVNVSPDLTLDWDNFSSGVDSFDITITATAPESGNSGPVYELTNVSDDSDSDVATFDTGEGTLGDTTGSASVSLSQKGLEATVTAIDASVDFPTDVYDGESETTTIDLAIDVTANNVNGNTPSTTDAPSFDVTLANPEAGSTTSGTVSTDGET